MDANQQHKTDASVSHETDTVHEPPPHAVVPMGEEKINRPLRWAVGVVIMAVGLGVAVMLFVIRDKETPKLPVYEGPSVEVMLPPQRDVIITVQGQGTVRPRAIVQLVPQISGRVMSVHSALAVGGFFDAGQTLIEIDPTDFELAIAQVKAQNLEAMAAISTGKAAIAEADARLADARIEAERITDSFNRGVANVREKERADLQVEISKAQVSSAQARLESAQASHATAQARLRQTELDRQRTRLTLPFAGRVLSKQVDVGQYVRAGESIASAYDVSRAEVLVPLPTDELHWFDVPIESPTQPVGAVRRQKSANDVELTASFAGAMQTWRGRVDRMEGEIDPRSRMARIVISIDHPFDTTDGPPLMPGLFVNAAIPGHTLKSVFVVPRHAVHRGDEVWVVQGGCINIRKVKVVRTDLDSAYIQEGLSADVPIVISSLDVVTDGMKVRPTRAVGSPETGSESTAEHGDTSDAASRVGEGL